MGIFGKKKDEEKAAADKTVPVSDTGGGCCCSGGAAPEGDGAGCCTAAGTCSVKILGSGCAKCNALESAAREALAELGMDTQIEHVTDFARIASYGVMSTPALVVDGKVVSFGRVLSKDAVVTILKKVRG